MSLPHAPPRCKVVCFLWPKKMPVALVANATQRSAAAPRPRSAPALSHRSRLCGSSEQQALPLLLLFHLSAAQLKKCKRGSHLPPTLCRPERFKTSIFINIHIHTHTYIYNYSVSPFIRIVGTATPFALWTGSQHHETLPHNLINSRPLVSNQIPNLRPSLVEKKIN